MWPAMFSLRCTAWSQGGQFFLNRSPQGNSWLHWRSGDSGRLEEAAKESAGEESPSAPMGVVAGGGVSKCTNGSGGGGRSL